MISSDTKKETVYRNLYYKSMHNEKNSISWLVNSSLEQFIGWVFAHQPVNQHTDWKLHCDQTILFWQNNRNLMNNLTLMVRINTNEVNNKNNNKGNAWWCRVLSAVFQCIFGIILTEINLENYICVHNCQCKSTGANKQQWN